MPTTPNYDWPTPADTDYVKDGAAAIRNLGDAIDTTVKSVADATITKDIVDAKGDLIAATAADTVARVAVGTNGQVLTADSSAATGMKWATAAGAGDNWVLITSQTITSGSTVTFSSISGYKKLRIFCGKVNNSASVRLRLNGDTGNNYSYTGRPAAGLNASSLQTEIFADTDVTGQIWFTFDIEEVNSSLFKPVTGVSTVMMPIEGLYFSTSEVTSVSIVSGGNFGSSPSSIFYLYGVAA